MFFPMFAAGSRARVCSRLLTIFLLLALCSPAQALDWLARVRHPAPRELGLVKTDLAKLHSEPTELLPVSAELPRRSGRQATREPRRGCS